MLCAIIMLLRYRQAGFAAPRMSRLFPSSAPGWAAGITDCSAETYAFILSCLGYPNASFGTIGSEICIPLKVASDGPDTRAV
jgi:hypothetical protein